MSRLNISVEQLMDVGAHFGHPTSKWNPNYENFIATKRNGIHIIDLCVTEQCINKAVKELETIIKSGGHVLFVGTKKQAKISVQEAADRCGMYYIVERWLGGTLTNFTTIKRSIRRLLTLEKQSSDIYQNITKKENSKLERERLKLSDLHRGIKDMKHLPRALFVVDGIAESIALKEAKLLDIPTFGIVDSNTNPYVVDFPIPANDDSVKCIQLIVNYISDVINEINNKGKDTSESNEIGDKVGEGTDQSNSDSNLASDKRVIDLVKASKEKKLPADSQ